jgi:hypothetical protein
MFRRALLAGIVFGAIVVFAQPAMAVSPEDLDLSNFPEGTKVLQIAQTAEGEPLNLCARPVRFTITTPGAWWFKVLVARGAGGHPFVWVLLQIVVVPPNTMVFERMECIKTCPGGASGTRCVKVPEASCPVCQE